MSPPLPGQGPIEARYRALVAVLPDAVVVSDLQGRILEVSDRAAELHGFDSPEEMIGRDGFELCAPEDREQARADLERLLRDGNVRYLQLRMLRKDGSVFLAELSASTVLDEAGQPVALITAMRDVTAREAERRALAESEQRYRALFEHAPVGLGIARPDGVILEANDVLLRQGGYSRGDLGRLNVNDLYADPADRPRALGELRRAGRVAHFETRFRRADGSVFDAVMSLSPVLLEGQPCAQAVIEDVSDRKHVAQELERRNAELLEANRELRRLAREKDDLLAMVSHELRTPLVTGLGYVALVADGRLGDLPGPVASALVTAQRSLERLSRLIDDILAHQRAPRGDPLTLGACDLARLCREAVAELAVRDRDAAARVTLAVPEALPPVRADEERIRRVITNLLNNAVRHAGEAARIRLELERRDDRVRVVVRDDGLGMPAWVRERAFEPFVKSESSREGSGLGLAIVRGILAAHGAEPELTSEPGRGTEVRFWLDLASDAPEPPADRERVPQKAPRRHGHVLVVEDDADAAEFVRLALESDGHRVVAAHDPDAAMRALRERPFDLVLLDLTLGAWSGLDLLSEIRAHPGGHALTVYMFTARAEEAALAAARQRGCDGYLTKPIGLGALLQAVRQALETRPPQ